MAGTIRPNDIAVATTPTLSAAALPSLDTTASTKKPSAPRTPRIDVEPLYAAVKSAVSDADWILYKKTISFFLLGNLNQEELSRTLKNILHTRELEHAHNALITAIYANIWRDAPEAGIASWVSSTDKPNLGQGSKGTGDESEKRLKVEVMGLSRRERKRLKGINNDAVNEGGWAQDYVEARRAKQIDTSALQTQGSGGFGKTSEFLLFSIHPLFTHSLCLVRFDIGILSFSWSDADLQLQIGILRFVNDIHPPSLSRLTNFQPHPPSLTASSPSATNPVSPRAILQTVQTFSISRLKPTSKKR